MSKLQVSHISIHERKNSNSINDNSSILRKKDASPNTNRNMSSDKNFPNRHPLKIMENIIKPSESPMKIHSKLTCQCDICQNKLNETINDPELMLDSFFEEDEKDIEKTAFFEIEKSCMLKNVSQISGLKSSIQLISDNELMDRDFLFVLKRLLPAKNSFYSLRILIPDTVVFLNGEAKFLIYNGNDDFLKCVRQKEKLTLNEIKDFFLERRSKKEKQFLAIQESILLSLIGNTSPQKSAKNSPKRKSNIFNGRVSLLPEEFNSEIVQGLDLKKVQETMKIKRFNDSSNTATKEFAFVRYKDNNVKILSEMDFLNLMSKRRIEKVLHDIVYLQMFLKPKKGTDSLIRVKYVYEKEKHKELFARSLKEVCYLTNLLPPNEENPPSAVDQESMEFELDLKKRNFREYSNLITYRIVHYIEAFYGIKIMKFIAEYLKDDFSNLWLMNCCHIKSYDTNSLKEPDYVLKKINLIDNEKKKKLCDDLEQIYSKASKTKKKKIDKITDMFIQNYEKKKFDLGIDLNAKTPEDSFSDNVFKNLNPSNPYTLSQILQNPHKPSLKRYILKNFPENLLKYDKETKDIEKLDSKLTNSQNLLKRPTSCKLKPSDTTKTTNYTSINQTHSTKFGVNYKNKNKKQEKFLSLCHNGFSKPNNINYNNFLGELINEKNLNDNDPIKIKNNFEIKKTKEKLITYQLTSNFFKIKKDIEPNGIDLTKYSLKNLNYTLPYLLYHKK